jgi:hypothetical protein
MKKFYLVLCSIILFSNPVHSADWRPLNATKDTKYFVDRESIKVIDDHVFYWEAMNLLDNEYDWKSSLAYFKADCDLKRYQILSESFYTEHFGRGNTLQTNNPDPKWKYPPPEAVSFFNLDIICEVAEIVSNDNKD